MILPKISYGSPVVNLNFTYPPVQKPGDEARHAERHDTLTQSGLRQSITERVDKFRTLQMDFVISGTDLAGWALFIDWAIQGLPFTYYPDHTDTSTHTDYVLEDTDWDPKWNFRGASAGGAVYKFTLKLRNGTATAVSASSESTPGVATVSRFGLLSWDRVGPIEAGVSVLKTPMPDFNFTLYGARALAPDVNPTATATYTIKKNGSSIGTVVFHTDGTRTITITSTLFSATTDRLELATPNPLDATLYGVCIVLHCRK